MNKLPKPSNFNNSIGPKNLLGFTMLESVIASVLFTIGTLGALSLQISNTQTVQSALYRSQASTIAYDMASKIRANPAQYTNNALVYNGFNAATEVHDTDNNPITSDSTCMDQNDGCSTIEQATIDQQEWAMYFNDISEEIENFTPILPGGNATIVQQWNSGDLETIINVTWTEKEWVEEGGDEDSFLRDINQSFTLSFIL